MKVTIFPSLTKTDNPQHHDVKTVLSLIQTGGKQKEFIEKLRTLDKEAYKTEKRKLPIICFGAELTQRNKEGIIKGTGLCILDFDGIEDPKTLRAQLESDECVYSVFMSPSGESGIKALFFIPQVNTDEEYKQYWSALKKKYPQADQSGKDIVRSCFFSYDPNIYINDKATVWDKKHLTQKERKQDSPYQVRSGAWDNINTALRKIEDALDGEKHDVRTKIAYLFGGYVGAKDMRYEDALKLLEGAVSKNTTDMRSAMKDIKDCLSAGMKAPLNITEQRAILNMEVGLGRKYKPMSETFDGVKDFWEKGYQRGWEIGWKSAHPYISLLRGSCSIWHGQPFSGKSQLVHETLINIVKYEERMGNDIYVAMLSPETGDVNQVYGELISIAARKSFVGEYKMDEETMIKYADWVSKHFILIDFEGESATVKDFFSQVESLEREFGIKISITSIDPANYLSVDEAAHSRRDLAVGRDLDFILANSRKYNRHNVLVTHDRDQQLQKNKENQWYYPVAHPREMMEGQQLYRKGMLIVCVYRPLDTKHQPLFDEQEGTPYKDNETHVWVQKAKPRGSSEMGMFKLFYEFTKNSYYEEDSFTGRKLHPWDYLEVPQKTTGGKIQPNTSFDAQVITEEDNLDPPF